MSVSYRNRKGDVYFLHEGRTKTGKPKYYFSRKEAGQLVEAIPPGYEIYEKPDSAQLYLRQVKPTLISEAERAFVQAECRRVAETEAVLVDIEKNSLVVYFAEGNDLFAEEVFRGFGFPSAGIREMLSWRVTHGRYMKMLRFTLRDEDRRLYSVDRWCFRGSIDNWFFVNSALPLDRAVAQYAPHLGKESFYELM